MGDQTSGRDDRRSPPLSDERRERHLFPLKRAATVLQGTVATSPADETEMVWIENRQGRVAHRIAEISSDHKIQRTIQVRVLEHGRRGCHRTSAASPGELSAAIRLAMAHALANPSQRVPPLPTSEEPAPVQLPCYDRRVARLGPEQALASLERHAAADEAAILEWCEGQVVVCNSRGLERRQRATAVNLLVRSGLGTGAGLATHAARSLSQLDAEAVFERARRRRTTEPPGAFPRGRIPLLLSPEATAELVDVLNHYAFAAHAYREGNSFLREHLGVQVFDRRLGLRDDATDSGGLPFPFDLEGRSKLPVELVSGGVPKTPTLDTRSAAEFGLSPTGHCVGGEDAHGLNLFMEPGALTDRELLETAEGGLWISRLQRVECFDPVRVRLRMVARGVRRVEHGALTSPVPMLAWEDSVLRIFSNILGIGQDTCCRRSSDGLLGGISAPAVVIGEASDLRPAA